jgi:hypothetical protein
MTSLKQIAVRLPPDLIDQLDKALNGDESRNARITAAIARDTAPRPVISDVRSPASPVIARLLAPMSPRSQEPIAAISELCIHCRKLGVPRNGKPCWKCGAQA